MAIRITGMYSGLDTESIINELASAQSAKKTKLVKQQKSYSWKMDAWKALNTKIYSFYQKLDDLRLQSSYMKKKTTVSDPNVVKVVSGDSTVDGVHTLRVESLAKRAYLTSGSLETEDGVRFRGGATLKQLGFTSGDSDNPKTGKITVNGALGQSVEIDVNENTTINDFVSKLQEVGLNANYDEGNQRIYISSKDTGESANFFLTGEDAGGFQALAALGLLSDVTSGPAYEDYQKWSSYDANSSTFNATERDKLIADLTAERKAAYEAQDKELEAENDEIDKANQYNKDELANLDGYSKYGTFAALGVTTTGDAAKDYENLRKALYDKIYGKETEVQKEDENGPVSDEDGNPVMETVRQGGLTQELEALQKKLAEDQESGASEADIEQIQKDIEAKQKEIAEANDCYSFVNAIATNEATKQANLDTLDEHAALYGAADHSQYGSKLEEIVAGEVQTKAAAATDALKGTYLPKNEDKLAHKIEGQDSVIYLNGVKYTSYNNSLTVNGMTITAMEETGEREITLSTSTDTDGIYDMIKGLFTEYNALINEMDSLYNAESSSGYEPLTSEEKEALSDDEIEEWEKKIKDSLLRRDSTLSTVSTAMKSVMMQGVSVNGKQMYLSDFGINTLGYFNAKENERNAYHIDGDADDSATKGNDDILRSLIATDPDTVMNFFVGLTNNMHDELANRMAATTLSSALTVYNDKSMKEEYDKFAEKIQKEEEKLNALMDKWYAKFSAMETAMAKLESKNNSLSSLLGG